MNFCTLEIGEFGKFFKFFFEKSLKAGWNFSFEKWRKIVEKMSRVCLLFRSVKYTITISKFGFSENYHIVMCNAVLHSWMDVLLQMTFQASLNMFHISKWWHVWPHCCSVHDSLSPNLASSDTFQTQILLLRMIRLTQI